MSLKIGFIGGGGIAHTHIMGLQKLNDVEIVCVYDVNRENAAKVAEMTGAQIMDDAEQVLDPDRIDAVFLCTPQFARDNWDVIAARRGIHIFVEKPLGMDVEIVREKEKIIKHSGVIHCAGYCLRYLDTVQEAKSYLSGRQVHLIQAFRFGGSHPAEWWHQLDLSGGHLVDAVTHQVDMIRYLAGEFRTVHGTFGRASFDRMNTDGTIYDAGAVSFTMRDGAIGSITESCLSNYHSASDLKLFGPDFFVHLSNNGTTLTIIDDNQHVTRTSDMNPHHELDRAFVEAVTGRCRKAILSDYEDGLKTLSVTLAANRSAMEQTAIIL